MNSLPSSGLLPHHPSTEELEASRQRLLQATQSSRQQLPGMVASALHRGFKGTTVINYAQWRRLQDFDAMRKRSLSDALRLQGH